MNNLWKIPHRRLSAKQQGYSSRKAALTLARCRHNRESFGVHLVFDRMEERWSVDYAFPLSPFSARKEGQNNGKVLRGRFGRHGPDYPGCPHCGDKVLFKCSCGRLTCFVTDDADFESFSCAWCGTWVDAYSSGWDSLGTHSGDL